ncbi:MAG: ComEA family DNA-binding protein [Lautropia sp.]
MNKLLAVLAGLLLSMNLAFALDVNTATQQELESIKGIGPTLSSRIVEERKKGGSFKDMADLESRVKGIGENNSRKFAEGGLTVGGGRASSARSAASAATGGAKPTAAAASAAANAKDAASGAAKGAADKARSAASDKAQSAAGGAVDKGKAVATDKAKAVAGKATDSAKAVGDKAKASK